MQGRQDQSISDGFAGKSSLLVRPYILANKYTFLLKSFVEVKPNISHEDGQC